MVAGVIGNHGQTVVWRVEAVHKRAGAIAPIRQHNMAAINALEAARNNNSATLNIAQVR